MNIPSAAPFPRFKGNGQIEPEEKPVPVPGPGQLLVQCMANALCASDMWAYHHGASITPGHEMSGVVAAAGDNSSIPIGTRGVVFLMDFCGECRSCRVGATNQCLNKRADYGFSHDGGYGPYALVNENVFFPIDDTIDFGDATLLLDIMGTGGHAFHRATLVCPAPDAILVTGAGPIGLGILAMAKILLGDDVPILITDVVPYRLALADQLGGLPINVEHQSLADGLEHYDIESVDIALDSTGLAQPRRNAFDALAKRGTLVCVGHGGDILLSVSHDLIGPERAVLGSEYFRYADLQTNLELFRVNQQYLRQIITHRFPVPDISSAFETFIARNTGKVLVVQ